MDDDAKSEHCKEVYAHAGLALYWAQCLEHSLENLILLHSRISGACVTQEQFEEFERDVEMHTLGRLLKDASKRVTLANDAEGVLTTALRRRNYLVHRFFKERSVDFMSQSGRDRMIAELVDIQECLRKADTVGSVICKALQHALGITDDWIEHELKRLTPSEDS